MVEGQPRQPGEGKPPRRTGIVGPNGLGGAFDVGPEGDGEHALARIAVDGGESTDGVQGGSGESCLLLEFPPRRVVGRLVDIHKPARKGPLAFAGLVAALDEQQTGRAIQAVTENKTVGRYGRMRIFISILMSHF